MTFRKFNLSKPLIRAIGDLRFTEATPIQEQAIPQITARKDIIGLADTGTGKTAAFAIPILNGIINGKKNRSPKALVLTPTRELASQVQATFHALSKYTNIRSTLIFGGVSQNKQANELRRGTDIIIATPGRLLDLMNQNLIELRNIETLVLDEADRMLDMGFVHDIRKIINVLPPKRQNICFSATMPGAFRNLATSLLVDPVIITIESEVKPDIRQFVYHVEKSKKRQLLKHILQNDKLGSTLVFSRTRHGANRIVKDLVRSGISAEAIHGDKSQNARERALDNFKRNSTSVLVATDIASRGIDIAELPTVINFDIPDSSETYTHRIGRTGRAGARGNAYSLVDKTEMKILNDIRRDSSNKITAVEHPFI